MLNALRLNCGAEAIAKKTTNKKQIQQELNLETRFSDGLNDVKNVKFLTQTQPA